MREVNFKHTEIGLIPHDWEVKTIKEIATLINGRAYRQDELLPDGKYKVLRVGNFFTNDSWYYSNLELEDKLYCHKGDLLYAWSCTYGAYIWNEDNTIFHYHIWRIECNNVVKKFLYYLLNDDVQKQKSASQGSTMTHITKGFLEQRSFPLPPTLAEQERIAGALSSIDTLIGALTEQIEKKRHIKQGTIQTLFRESNKWERKAFGDILRPIPKGTLKTTDLKPTGYPVINSGKTLYGYYDNYNNEGEAITIAARGEYAGWISYFNEKFWAGGLCYPYSVKDKNSLNTKFLYYALKKVEGDIMENLVARGSIPALNKSDLEQFIILVPPTIEEQASIANTLSSMDDSIAALEQKRDKYIAIKSGMMQNLLTGKIRLV